MIKAQNQFRYFKVFLRSPNYYDAVRQVAIAFRIGFVKTAGDLTASEFINKVFQIKAGAKAEHKVALAEKENALSA